MYNVSQPIFISNLIVHLECRPSMSLKELVLSMDLNVEWPLNVSMHVPLCMYEVSIMK